MVCSCELNTRLEARKMKQGRSRKYRPVIEETGQSSAPIHGRGASWSPANRFEKLHIDLNDADVVDTDPDAEPPSVAARRGKQALTYGVPEEQPRRATQYFRDGSKTIITRNSS